MVAAETGKPFEQHATENLPVVGDWLAGQLFGTAKNAVSFTFYVGTLKGVGRIYQQSYVDPYSKVAQAKLYTTKTPITAADLLNDRVLPFHDEHDLPVLRIMTDRGTEYCGRVDKHDYQLFLAINDIDHTKTKVKSPQTNGIRERFHKTVLQEFYQVAFRRKLYDSIDALQGDLDDWLYHYNSSV